MSPPLLQANPEVELTEGIVAPEHRDYIASIHRAAKDYAALGLPVFSLAYRSKRPDNRRGWQERATTDPDVVDRTFSHDQPENLGIATGRGIVFVLDVDPGKGGFKSLEQLEEEHGSLPETTLARTGGGGRHYFFRVPSDMSIGNAVGLWPGLDIRGDGGLVVASPSVHPDTGLPYEWIRHPSQGIAPPPAWLLEALQARSGGRLAGKGHRQAKKPNGRQKVARKPQDQNLNRRAEHVPKTREQKRSPKPVMQSPAPKGRQPIPCRTGNPSELLADVVKRFPVPGFGHRHNMMCKAVGSLLGRGYSDDFIFEVLMGWWECFDAQGKVRTARNGMEQELLACLRATRANARFRAAHGQCYHEAARMAIQLDDEQRKLLKISIDKLGPTVSPESRPPDEKDVGLADIGVPPEDPHSLGHSTTPCKRVTRVNGSSNRLCESRSEEQFVEVLIVVVTYKRDEQGETMIRVTHDQIRRDAAARFGLPMPVWDNRQIQRLKDKFVTRLGQPATVF